MIKAASVGLGWWSDELAKSIQGKNRKIKIVSCYSNSKNKQINFSKKYKTDIHETYNSVVKDPNIDAVILTTPHSLHSQHSIKRSLPIEPFPTTPIRKVPESIPKPPSILQQPKIQPMQIKITPLSFEDITNISRASEIVRDILNELPNIIQPGITTDAIDEFVHNSLIEQNAYPGKCYIYIFPQT